MSRRLRRGVYQPPVLRADREAGCAFGSSAAPGACAAR